MCRYLNRLLLLSKNFYRYINILKGFLTLYSCKRFLLFREIYFGTGNVSENDQEPRRSP